MRITCLLATLSLFFVSPIKAQTPTIRGQAMELSQEARKHIENEDYLQALEAIEDFLELIPTNGTMHDIAARCNYYLGDRQSSCFYLDRAMELGQKRNKRLYQVLCDDKLVIKSIKKYDYADTRIEPENGYRPVYTLRDSLRGALRPERTCFDVVFYDLTVRILPLRRSIVGSNKVYFKAVHSSKRIQLDLFPEFTVESVTMDSTKLKFYKAYNALFIEFPDSLQAGESYTIDVKYSGKPSVAENPPWQGGFVWNRDKRLNRWVSVACEHLGASSWWPVKDHLSDRPDSMAMHFEVPKAYQAISNGSFRGAEDLQDGYKRYNWFVHYPINSYNVTFYMGKYTQFTDTIITGTDTLNALYHVMPYNKEIAMKHFQQAEAVVDFYNRAYGPFPFWEDGFRMCETPFEGMEHQTAIAYGGAYSNEENSKTYSIRDFDYLIVHEAAHEWWGNSVAAADMADVWLHEGFATYAEIMFIEDQLGEEAAMKEMHNKLHYILNFYPLVQNRNVNENSFAGQDVYNKGAAMLQCLRASINNDTIFRSMLRDFHLSYRDSTIESQDFIDYVHSYTGQNYDPLFNIYLYKTELPVLEYKYERVNGDFTLSYRWTGTDPEFTMPFSIGTIVGNKGIRLEAGTQWQTLELPNEESFHFFNDTYKPEGCPHNGLTYYRTRRVSWE